MFSESRHRRRYLDEFNRANYRHGGLDNKKKKKRLLKNALRKYRF